MPPVKRPPEQDPLDRCLKVLGGKWHPWILWRIHQGSDHFGTLRRALPAISKQALANGLRVLCEAGILAPSRSQPGIQPKSYSLTPAGEALIDIVLKMREWGESKSPMSEPSKNPFGMTRKNVHVGDILAPIRKSNRIE